MIRKRNSIILRSFDYRNTSKIIHVLTENSRNYSIVAKGARRTNSKFGGNIEPLNLSEILFYIKEDRDIGLLKEATIKQGHLSLKSNLKRLNIAWGLSWISDRVPDPINGLYGLLKRSLDFLDRGFEEEVIAYFLLSFYSLNGIPPELEQCVSCGSREVEFFHFSSGGAQCKKCRSNNAYHFARYKNNIVDLKKGRLRTWEEVEGEDRKYLLLLLYKYGIYHLGEWMNRFIEIVPSEIIPKER